LPARTQLFNARPVEHAVTSRCRFLPVRRFSMASPYEGAHLAAPEETLMPADRAAPTTANPARTEAIDVLSETLWTLLLAGQAPLATSEAPARAKLRVAAPRITQPLDSQAV
jgi:hypothetical protein